MITVFCTDSLFCGKQQDCPMSAHYLSKSVICPTKVEIFTSPIVRSKKEDSIAVNVKAFTGRKRSFKIHLKLLKVA